MGYGSGAFLLAVGLILALAVDKQVQGIEVTTIGWILAAVGAVVLVLSAITWNRGRAQRTVATTTHSDGSQTVQERRSNEY
jgi:hypothetical protein